MKYGPVEDKCMKLAIFPAEVDAFGRKFLEKKAFVQFAASKASIHNFRFHASHHGTKMRLAMNTWINSRVSRFQIGKSADISTRARLRSR